MSDTLAGFDEVWSFDFEYLGGDAGERYDVVCLAARELRSNRTLKLWRDELGSVPPYRTDDKVLFACFAAHAECGCHLALHWPLPERVLDLSPEYKNFVNGRAHAGDKRGLLDALRRYGLPSISKGEKDFWRDIVLRGPPWSENERVGILRYCLSDVDGSAALLQHMLPAIDLPRAFLRGEFVKASTWMEWRGVPIDMGVFVHLRDQRTWDQIRETLIPPVDAAYGVFNGRVFKHDKFEAYLARNKIPWPRLDSEKLDLQAETFRERAKAYPQIGALRELRHTLAKLRSIKLQVGADGRARTVLWPFASKTGRTQPSASKYILGPSVWLRSLIRPEPGRAIAYCDWTAMEFGIAGALSNDRKMLEAYGTDPYLSTAIAFGKAPPGATDQTHGDVRELFKVVLLAAQYEMQAPSLASRLGVSVIEADEILQQHRRLYGTYWHWSDAWVHRALSSGQMRTNFGWGFYLDRPSKERTLRNWPIQSHGAEILRLTCVWATKRGLQLLAPLHDALLLEAPTDRIEQDVALLQEIMRRGSRIVLNPSGGSFTLRSKAAIVRYPDRYSDKRGVRMWSVVAQQLALQVSAGDQNVAAR
jgi:DNA polymerase-1